jgi:hypothetical protein
VSIEAADKNWRAFERLTLPSIILGCVAGETLTPGNEASDAVQRLSV